VHYSASEVSKKLGLTKDCLRYYEKVGLLPPIERDSNGYRVFSESDVEWVFLIRCLRDTDMKISKIKEYVSLLMNNCGSSIHERRDFLLEHKSYISKKITIYQNILFLINKKLDFYNEAISPEYSDQVKCMDYADEWEHFRSILKDVKIE